jgi:predicted nuclease of predicted toxin-antitoxin system
VKLLVDMNLSASWIDRLARHGFEAFHWSTIGAANAPDDEILTWARQHNLVVLTLDFSAILAAGGIDGPSVVQICTQNLLSDGAVSTSPLPWKRTRRTSSEARSCRLTKAGCA